MSRLGTFETHAIYQTISDRHCTVASLLITRYRIKFLLLDVSCFSCKVCPMPISHCQLPTYPSISDNLMFKLYALLQSKYKSRSELKLKSCSKIYSCGIYYLAIVWLPNLQNMVIFELIVDINLGENLKPNIFTCTNVSKL